MTDPTYPIHTPQPTKVMLAREQSNRTAFCGKPTLIVMLAFALMSATVADAGVILSSSDKLLAKDGSAGVSMEVIQRPEDSKRAIVQNSGFGSEMTAPSVFEVSELPSAVQIVEWLPAPSQTGERMTLRQDLNLPAPIPIELLKIPIATATTYCCG